MPQATASLGTSGDAAKIATAPVLPRLDPFVFPMWLTTHRKLNTSPRVHLGFAELGR